MSDNTVNKKIREAQLQQWNYLLVVGEKERADKTVTVRDRADPEHQKVLSLEELIAMFEAQGMPNSKKTLTVSSCILFFLLGTVLRFPLVSGLGPVLIG